MQYIVTCGVKSEIRLSSGSKSGNCVKGSCLLETGDTSSSQVKCAQLEQILLQCGCAKLSGPWLVEPLQNLKLQGCQSVATMIGYHHILTAMRKLWLSVVLLHETVRWRNEVAPVQFLTAILPDLSRKEAEEAQRRGQIRDTCMKRRGMSEMCVWVFMAVCKP